MKTEQYGDALDSVLKELQRIQEENKRLKEQLQLFEAKQVPVWVHDGSMNGRGLRG
jgi:hypothetical protein